MASLASNQPSAFPGLFRCGTERFSSREAKATSYEQPRGMAKIWSALSRGKQSNSRCIFSVLSLGKAGLLQAEGSAVPPPGDTAWHLLFRPGLGLGLPWRLFAAGSVCEHPWQIPGDMVTLKKVKGI